MLEDVVWRNHSEPSFQKFNQRLGEDQAAEKGRPRQEWAMEFQAGALFRAAVVMPEAGDRSLGARHSSGVVWTLEIRPAKGSELTVSSLEFENQLPSHCTSLSPSSSKIAAHLWSFGRCW